MTAAAAAEWAAAPIRPLQLRGHFQATEPLADARARAVAAHREKRRAGREAAAEAVRTCEAERAEHAAAVAALQFQMEHSTVDFDEMLIIEHVLQPSTYGLPNGRLSLDFRDLRKRSGASPYCYRGRPSPPSPLPSSATMSPLLLCYIAQTSTVRDSRFCTAATHVEGGKERSDLDAVRKSTLDSMSDLQLALRNNESLHMTAVEMIDKHVDFFTRAVSDRAGHGRLVRRPGETFMQLLTRYHEEGEGMKRHKAGRLPKAALEFPLLRPRKTMVKGRYTVEAIMLSHIMRHRTAKRALAYASINELTRAGVERMIEGLDELPEWLVPRLQHPNTDTLHDIALHTICMQWFLEDVGLRGPLQLAQDELSKRKRAFSVHTLIGTSARDGERTSEMIGFPELHADASGHVKTGENIGNSMWCSIVKMLQPGSGRSPAFVLTSTARRFIKNIQWGLLDSTSVNTGFYHGAHTVLRKRMHSEAGHILYFMMLCLAHIANNEYGEVLEQLQHAPDGSSKRQLFSRKRVVRAETSKEVPRLVGVIEDAGYVALHVHGLMRYLKKKRGLKRLRKPDIGVVTRWLFDDDLLEWLLETMDEAKAKEADEVAARARASLRRANENPKAKPRDVTAAKLAVDDAAEAARQMRQTATQGRPAAMFERLDDMIEYLLHVWTDGLVGGSGMESEEVEMAEEEGEEEMAEEEEEGDGKEEDEDEETPSLTEEEEHELLAGSRPHRTQPLGVGEILQRMEALGEHGSKEALQRYALISELMNPEVRIWMVGVKLYGTEVLTSRLRHLLERSSAVACLQPPADGLCLLMTQ